MSRARLSRRTLFQGASAGALAGGLLPFAAAQAVAEPVHQDVVDFWVNRVGVPADLLLGGPERSSRPTGAIASRTAAPNDYGSEPLFLYLDDKENTLIPAQELQKGDLLPYGDAMVDLSVGRLRLNPADQKVFPNSTTSGIYFEIGQEAPRQSPNLASLGWSLFGALAPQQFARLGGQKGAAPQAPSQPPQTPLGGLMKSIALPGGTGQAMFNCFLKDQRRSTFGTLLSVFADKGMAALASFVPILMLPGIAQPAMNFVRGLVGRMQGSQQRFLFQQTPMNLVCTAEMAGQRQQALKVRTGSYVVLPKSQAGQLKSSLNDLKVIDGFLVPKNATMFDVFDAAPQTIPGVSYLTANVTVKRAQLSSCIVAGGTAR